MGMYNPPHPGEFIREVYLEPFHLSARQVAAKLRVSPSTFNRVLNGDSGVTPEMALRLAKTLGRSPESRLAISIDKLINLLAKEGSGWGIVRAAHATLLSAPPSTPLRTGSAKGGGEGAAERGIEKLQRSHGRESYSDRLLAPGQRGGAGCFCLQPFQTRCHRCGLRPLRCIPLLQLPHHRP